MKNICAVYHWWDEPNDSPAYANLRAPIIVSIATLRAVNPDIPIVVLDIGKEERDWKHFPEKLNFEVWKITPNLQDCQHLKGWKHLSRFYDVHLSIYAENILYIDADVFWFKDPLPLAGNCDKFCFDSWNTGFYYYNRYSDSNAEFLKRFITYTRAAIYSNDIRSLMRPYVGYDSWHVVWDEMICGYMTHKHPELFDKITLTEHGIARLIHQTGNRDVNMLHCNGIMVDNKVPKTDNEKMHCRGLLGLLIKEFYDNMLKVLDEDDMKLIYSTQEISYYLPQQSSFYEINWGQIKSEDGHYHIGERRPHPFII